MMRRFHCHQLVSQLMVMMTVRLSCCQAQDWTWLGGEKMADRNSNNDHPGGRSGSSVWVDQNGTAWMFAGNGFSDLSAGKPHVLNDIWSFSLNSKKFKLQHPGTWTSNSSEPSVEISDVPVGRQHAGLCGDNHRLVVFGGYGEGGSALGDLWTYDTLTKVWFKVYDGNSDVEVVSADPAPRGHSSVWCYDSSMYLFGGMNDNNTVFCDMWRLNLLSLKWTRLDHNCEVGSPHYPSGRNGASTWLSNDVFYMFGGNTDSDFSYTIRHTAGLTSDLWQYHPHNNTWQHISATMSSDHHEGHSMMSMSRDTRSSNSPGHRISAGTWTDSEGSLWLFGGAGSDAQEKLVSSKLFSDVWRFHLGMQNWALMRGEVTAKYGDLGKRTPGAFPGARTDMMVWQDQKNLAYVFGGLGHDGMNIDGYLNDLWSVDVTLTVNREYMISPLSLFLFLGLGSSALVAVLVLALCSRQRPSVYGNGLRLKLNAEYTRVENEES